MGYDIKKTLDAVQTDLDTTTEGEIGSLAVTEGKIGTAAVTAAKIGAGAVTTDKAVTTRVQHGCFVEPSGSDLWIKWTAGCAIITGASVDIAAGHALLTVAGSGKEKVGIVEASSSGNGTVYVKYGAEVDAGFGTGAFPATDSNCVKIANLFAIASGSTITQNTSAVAATNISNAAGSRI